MLPGRIIAFTTDFGHVDTFVGEMKGAALSVNPDLALVDLTHEVPAHDISAGGYLLWTGYRAFPAGTVHVAVVDPGVGTERRGIAVRTSRYTFVAPDNGLLTRVLDDETVEAAHAIVEPRFMRPEISSTFHGRDVFAPVAAWLTKGVGVEELGPKAVDLVRIEPAARALIPNRSVPVRVLAIDRFGNATLDVPRSAVASLPEGGRVEVRTPGGIVRGLHRTYADGQGDRPFLIVNSAGHLEIAILCGNAADRLGLDVGTGVDVRLVVEC